MRTFILAVIFLFLVIPAYAISPETQIIEQPDSPVKISAYNASYKERGRYTTEGIHHQIIYNSNSQKKITAIQFGFVSFDVWNEFLDRMNGVTIKDMTPGKADQGTWVATALADFTFLTGFAYVSKVRFEDNTIWEADLQAIAAVLQGVEQEFDVQKLEGKTPE